VSDTSEEIDRRLGDLFAALSPTQRVLMAAQMFETAQRIVLSSLPPDLDDRSRKRELCRRFYGDELARRAFPLLSPRGLPQVRVRGFTDPST
jgi:hypothetical protein